MSSDLGSHCESSQYDVQQVAWAMLSRLTTDDGLSGSIDEAMCSGTVAEHHHFQQVLLIEDYCS